MHGQTVPLCLNINSPLNEILVTRFEKKMFKSFTCMLFFQENRRGCAPTDYIIYIKDAKVLQRGQLYNQETKKAFDCSSVLILC
jgi:hypothetical protein